MQFLCVTRRFRVGQFDLFGRNEDNTPPETPPAPAGESRAAQAKRLEIQAIALARQNKTDAALQAYRQAAALEPGTADYQYNLGIALEDAGQYAAALIALRKAALLKPRDGDTQRELGNTLTSLNRKTEAVAAYRRALQLNPRDAAAANNLGNVLDSLGKHTEAIAAYRQALKIDPNYALAKVNLAQSQRNQEEKKHPTKKNDDSDFPLF